MAKQKVSTDFLRCDGFWQPEKEGDRIRGVLVSANMVEDRKQGGKRPLYIVATLDANPKNIMLEKKPVKLGKGDLVGVNGSFKIDMAIKKLGGVRKVCGHEIDITFKGKEELKTGNSLKQYAFEWDDEPNKEFASKVVMPDEGWDKDDAAASDKVPFDVPAN